MTATPTTDETDAAFRERCKAFYQQQGRRNMFRTGCPVEDIVAFVLSEIDRSVPASNETDAATGWRDMATAPKDGTRVLLLRTFAGQPYIVCGEWDADPHAARPRPLWRHDSIRWQGLSDARANPPVGWMPLPTASARIDMVEKNQAVERQLAKYRDLLTILLENDPSEPISDGGHVVLDLWRHDVRNEMAAEALRAGNTTEAGR